MCISIIWMWYDNWHHQHTLVLQLCSGSEYNHAIWNGVNPKLWSKGVTLFQISAKLNNHNLTLHSIQQAVLGNLFMQCHMYNCCWCVDKSHHCHNNNKGSTNWCAALEHVLQDKNTFLRLHKFDLIWSKQQVLVRNRRLISDQLAVSSKSSLMWYRLSVLVSCL